MTMHYTEAERRFVESQVKARAEALDLYVCSDGIMRCAEEKAKFEAEKPKLKAIRGL